MRLFKLTFTHFHCSKCLKAWIGFLYYEYCPECIFSSTIDMSYEDKNVVFGDFLKEAQSNLEFSYK